MTHSAAALLDSLAAEYWQAQMARNPTWATQLSLDEHDGRLEDASQEAKEAWRGQLTGFLARLRDVDETGLTEARRVTLSMLEEQIGNDLLVAGSGMDLWSVDQLAGPQVALFDLVRTHHVQDARSATTWLDRVRAMPRLIDQHVANLRLGLGRGLVAPQATVTRVLEQLDETLAAEPATWTLVTAPSERPPDIGEPEWQSFKSFLTEACRDHVRPAFERFRAFLRYEIAPRARSMPGLTGLAGGERVYATSIRIHLGFDKSPLELHETGLSEVARIREQMEERCAALFPGRTLAESLLLLREDPRHSFGTPDEILAAARAAVRRATDAARECFDLLPDHECEVRPVDAHAAKASPAAFYVPPAPDGSRPGTYYVNTCEPSSRPRHEAEVVAFHEAVPGHHVQLALAQTLERPEFQRHAHNTAYVEGWALYTERLADELGLYTGPLDLLGLLSCDALRAARLVVDTGLHAMGWSRERAIAYMTENTTASMTDIRNEIDRYITWPGQALAYKTGQLEILALRRQAEAALGPRFRLGAFHAAVLEHGGVTLPVLRRRIQRFIQRAG